MTILPVQLVFLASGRVGVTALPAMGRPFSLWRPEVNMLYIALAVFIVPLLFLGILWAVLTAYRLIHPEAPSSEVPMRMKIRQRVTTQVTVASQERRGGQRRQHTVHPPAPYCYGEGEQEGVPTAWLEDLWRRRN